MTVIPPGLNKAKQGRNRQRKRTAATIEIRLNSLGKSKGSRNNRIMLRLVG